MHRADILVMPFFLAGSRLNLGRGSARAELYEDEKSRRRLTNCNKAPFVLVASLFTSHHIKEAVIKYDGYVDDYAQEDFSWLDYEYTSSSRHNEREHEEASRHHHQLIVVPLPTYLTRPCQTTQRAKTRERLAPRFRLSISCRSTIV